MNKELIFIIIAVIWTLPWKGFALWKSARKGNSGWFIFFLLINTLAIFEILYIFVFSEKKQSKEDPSVK